MFIIIVLLAIMGLIGTDIFVPSLPAIAEIYHQSPNHAQLTISVFLAGFALSQLFYGPISDAVGRKPPLIVGVIIFICGSLLCIFAPSFSLLCIGRIIQGFGVGAGLSLARVILRDCYKDTLLAVKTAQIAIFVSLTPALAPFFGGLLQQQFGFQASFVFMLGYGLLVLFLLMTRFQETLQFKNPDQAIHTILVQYGQLLRNTAFMKYAIIAGLAFTSIILYANIMPFIVQSELNLSPAKNGLIILIAALGISLGSFISSRAVRHVLPKQLIHVGLMIFAINGLLLLVANYIFGTTLVCLVPLIFLITMACGFIFPNAIALCFSEINCHVGIAGAIYGSMQTFISMLANFLLNAIPHQGQALLGAFYLGIGLMGLALKRDRVGIY
ncbi:multidrug effflux MFS transporter [Aquicella lusitana]|uniref:Bcr/CflA family efflux transporter n=1 Tax=Aquicella lusitana TaxID=254246 RepID=A0A370GKC9_9COXI|nr:multidrug effflux MFS transporter [Aquicella lusitana]RDI43820.1 Bcr/CflA subfamily drug resistance transporter [Aquicella lusitana]VVC74449.1 Inner membrane transport protein YdhC [Aquicella lusitana]